MFEQRQVELRVVGEHADRGAPVDLGGAQVAVRPVDHDLVGVREAGGGGEHRAGVADRDAVAEERADPGQRRREVDRPEHQQARRGHAALDEQRDRSGAAGLARVDDDPGRAPPGAGQGAGQGGRRPVQGGPAAQGAQAAAVRVDQQRPAEHPGRAVDGVREGDGAAGGGLGQGCGDRRAGPGGHRGDQQFDGAAAGELRGERVVGARPEPGEGGFAARQGLPAEFVDRALDAAAGDAADRGSVAVDGEGGPGLPGGAAVDGDERGDGELAVLPAPFDEFCGDVQHCRPLFSMRRRGLGMRNGGGAAIAGRGRLRLPEKAGAMWCPGNSDTAPTLRGLAKNSR